MSENIYSAGITTHHTPILSQSALEEIEARMAAKDAEIKRLVEDLIRYEHGYEMVKEDWYKERLRARTMAAALNAQNGRTSWNRDADFSGLPEGRAGANVIVRKGLDVAEKYAEKESAK